MFQIEYEILDAMTNLPIASPITNFISNVNNLARSFSAYSDNGNYFGDHKLKI